MAGLNVTPESDFQMVDLHCHPSIKPFGRSYPGNKNSDKPNEVTSIWKYDPPTRWDKILNILPGITRFSQANFTSLHKGKVRVAFCALNPIEQGFFRAHGHTGRFADKIYDFVTGIGIPKIDFIQGMDNYWDEFNNEYNFYEQLNGHIVHVDGKDLKYSLTKDYNDVAMNLSDPWTISVVLTIEGAYVFNPSITGPFNDLQILANIKDVKKREIVPFMISISHHFYNYTGGHAKSFHGIVAWAIDQTYGIHTGMTNFGKSVIRTLLDKKVGKRIYIDLKHMSVQMRKDYYKLIDTEYNEEEEKVPLIVSHGALNGLKSIYAASSSTDEEMFYKGDVNFYDDEVVMIARSNGIFGLQLDDRLISGKKRIFKYLFQKEKGHRFRAGLLCNHLKRAAEILDRNNLDSWNTIAIGTDFDGIVDPPNGFWTAEDMPGLYSHMHECISDYMKPGNNQLQQVMNSGKNVDDIMRNLFSQNAIRFMSAYYK